MDKPVVGRITSLGRNGDSPRGRNGQEFLKGGVVLQREYRVNLDRAHQEVLEAVAKFNGMSPSAWLEHAASWSIRRAHEEISYAFAIGNFLVRFPFEC